MAETVGIQSVKFGEWMYSNCPMQGKNKRHVLFWGKAGSDPTNDDTMRFEIHRYENYMGIRSVKFGEWMYSNCPMQADNKRHVLFWGKAGSDPTNDESMRFHIQDFGDYVGIKSLKFGEWMYANCPMEAENKRFALFWGKKGQDPTNDDTMRFWTPGRPGHKGGTLETSHGIAGPPGAPRDHKGKGKGGKGKGKDKDDGKGKGKGGSRFLDLDNQHAPCLALQHTKFLQEYNKTSKPPTVSEVVQGLKRRGQHNTASQFEKEPGDVTTRAIRLWTSNNCYQTLNQCLIEDEWMECFAVLCRAMNCYIGANPLLQRTETYRGSKLSAEQVSQLEVGKVYRPPYYIASSKYLDQAMQFKIRYIVIFDIPASCPNASDITHLNVFGENEILIPPYTPIKLMQIGWIQHKGASHQCLRYTVLDGKVYENQVEKPVHRNPSDSSGPQTKKQKVTYLGEPAKVLCAGSMQ